MTHHMPENADHEYLSFKEVVAGFQSYWKEIWKNQRFFFFCLTLCLIYGIYNRWKEKRIFEAEVTFMINEERGSASGLGVALGDFGGLLGVGSDVNLQKILELAKSRNISEKVFAGSAVINDKNDFMANHLISEFERTKQWTKNSWFQKTNPLKGFRFKEFNPEKFGPVENLALKNLHALFLKMLNTNVSEKTSIMKLTIQGTHETIVYELATRLYNEMSNFYIDKMVEKQRETFVELRHKTDSLKALIESKVYKLAGIRDSYRSTWLYHEDVPKTILDQEIQMLQVVYGETLKNREIASFALENRTPFIQAIDLPIIPLKMIQQSWFRVILLSLFYGFLLGAGLISIRKFFRDQLR
jgi:uncharacterized protein involved in exopolysaccharide biosynthesis